MLHHCGMSAISLIAVPAGERIRRLQTVGLRMPVPTQTIKAAHLDDMVSESNL